MEKYGFVYIWYDCMRKMYYVGCHWGTVNDGYICSSNRMRDAYRRRSHDFKRRILKTGIERSKLLEEEYKWLQLIKKEELGKKYYNVWNNHFGHWSHDPERKKTTGERISKAQKIAFDTKEHKTKISEAQKKRFRKNPDLHPMKNRNHSEETKQKIREARAKQTIILTEETKRKISEAHQGKIMTEEHKRKLSESHMGHTPWNKGKKNVYSQETLEKMRMAKKPII